MSLFSHLFKKGTSQRRSDDDQLLESVAKEADFNAKWAVSTAAFLLAVSEGKEEVVEQLIARGADVNLTQETDGHTVLQMAAIRGNEGAVRALIRHGADVNAKNRQSGTALMAAAWKGHYRIVKILLNNGADPNRKDRFGKTALDLAKEKGHQQVVSLLS